MNTVKPKEDPEHAWDDGRVAALNIVHQNAALMDSWVYARILSDIRSLKNPHKKEAKDGQAEKSRDQDRE